MSLLRDEEEARQEAVFGRAEKVRNDGKEREIKVIYGGIEGATTLARGSISRVNKPELSQESATYQRWSGLFQSYQLDWWHYERKLRAALPGEVKLQQELMSLLWEGKREEHRKLLKLKYLVDGEKLDDLLGYLEENWGK